MLWPYIFQSIILSAYVCLTLVFLLNGNHTALLLLLNLVIEHLYFKMQYCFTALHDVWSSWNYMYHLWQSHSISVNQLNFLKGHSCLQVLLTFLNDVFNWYDNEVQTDVLCLDFRNAFYSVSHSHLLRKLNILSIIGFLWNWFETYISTSQQTNFPSYCLFNLEYHKAVFWNHCFSSYTVISDDHSSYHYCCPCNKCVFSVSN